ncbi:MAG: starch-binding protein, partial [Muribaculaceae bacterium]|nr:starch-binding protein [Muribaculaceae bacterium]
VPALRKGQYTFDGCTANGGWAFKRAYKNESYALVAVNGGATFSNVPAGTYTDIVTGKTYQGGGSITVDAPKGKGQLRVLVKDWTGGKIVDEGKFIYSTSSVSKGGKPTATDPGANFFYTKEDAEDESAGVFFSPAGGTFRTETLQVTASLSPASVTGWYQVAGQQKVTLTPGNSSTFTIGQGISYGESVSVAYEAVNAAGEKTSGTVSYKKVDPNASITVYVKGPQGINMYAWGDDENGKNVTPCGSWPGKTLTETVTVDGSDFYFFTFDGLESVNIIFNRNGAQTPDIKGITADTYFEYDGATSAQKIDVNVTPVPSVKFSPNGGNFVDNVAVTATVSNATSAWYRIGNGAQTTISGNSATFTLGDDMSIGESVTVSWSATNGTETKSGSVKFTKIEQPVVPDGITVYYDNSVTRWSSVKIHHWPVEETSWPGVEMEKVGDNIYMYVLPEGTTGVVFNNGNGDQTNDISNPVHNHVYKGTGNRNWEDAGEYVDAGVSEIEVDESVLPVEFYNMQGMRVTNPTRGFYIMRRGSKVEKIYIR